MNIFNTLLVQPLTNLLVGVYQALMYFHVPGALGFSIILSTVLIRLILYPFTVAQIKTSKKMQEMQPHMSRLKEKHKNDPKRLQQEQMALFKEHGINPAAGCLPTLIQIVLLYGFYSSITRIIALKPQVAITTINKIVYFDFLKLHHVWDTNFFGLPLVKSPAVLMHPLGVIILLFPVITALLQFVQTKMMVPPASASPAVNKPTNNQEDFAQALQSQMLFMTPVIIGIVSYQFPLGLSLYWNTFTIFGIIQQYQVQGPGSLSSLIKWRK